MAPGCEPSTRRTESVRQRLTLYRDFKPCMAGVMMELLQKGMLHGTAAEY